MTIVNRDEYRALWRFREHFEGVRESDNGYLRPSKRKLVDVFVSRGTLDRALAFANRLFRALEAQGH